MQNPAWMVEEISEGLAKLVALRLDQQPPEDTITATLAVWVEAICAGRVWSFERDAVRFRRAFLNLECTRTKWPAPRDFLEALPSRVSRVERSCALTSDTSIRTGKIELAKIAALLGLPPKQETVEQSHAAG